MNNKKYILYISALTFALGSPISIADPYAHCAKILNGGVFNINKVVRDKSSKKYAHLWLCNQTYSSSDSELGTSINAVYEGVTGGGEYNRSKFNEYKSNYCNFDSSSFSEVEKSFMYSQLADKNIIDAWSLCIGKENKGLVCSADKLNEKEVLFKVNMKYSPAGNLSQAKMQLKNLEDVFNNGIENTIIQGDEYAFNLTKQNSEEVGIVQISGKTNQGRTHCNYIIPSTENIPLPDFELEKLKNLVSVDKFDTGNHRRTYSTQSGTCTVEVSEKLSITNSSVNKDKTSIHIGYQCTRPDLRYKCGGGAWDGPHSSNYSGKVSASITVSSGVLQINSVTDHDNNEERNCGNVAAQYIRSLNGIAL